MDDLEKLYDWLMDENRKLAQTYFTAGMARNIAKEIEYRLSISTPAADKGDAIEFAEWIEGTDYWYDKEDKVWHGGDCMEIEYTTQQLYELFHQTK